MRERQPVPLPTSSTRLFGLLGHPVSHSLSPAMHNAAFRALGLDACYLAFDVSPEALAEALAGARALGAGGFNVTVPHKEQALRLATEVDPEAAAVGAANTLLPARGGWKAFNTDVTGFLRALAEDLDFRAEGRRAVVLGAGGAARAAAVGLLRSGIQEILVLNRNEERAEKLASDLRGAAGGNRITPGGLGDGRAFGFGAGDLVVSATPLGLHEGAQWPLSLARFPAGTLLYDMAYGPGETPLVEQARRAGFRAASGRRMLLHQGAAAFSLWTEQPAPIAAMEEALSQPSSVPAL